MTPAERQKRYRDRKRREREAQPARKRERRRKGDRDRKRDGRAAAKVSAAADRPAAPVRPATLVEYAEGLTVTQGEHAGDPWEPKPEAPADKANGARKAPANVDPGKPGPWTYRVSDVDALRAHLIAELEAATVADVKAADAENARPIAEAGAPDAAGVLAAVADVAHYNRRYDAGARTVATLTRPADWPAPTTEALAAWLLGSPEAALLTPADAWTERERWAHRAAERWLRDFDADADADPVRFRAVLHGFNVLLAYDRLAEELDIDERLAEIERRLNEAEAER